MMKRSFVLVALMAILGSGCSGQSTLNQAGTMVAQTITAAPPTDTPPPTSSPPPSQTSTPRPTATPNIALTSTVEAFHILSEIDVWVGSNSGVPYREGRLAWRQAEPVTIGMRGPQKNSGALHLIGEDIRAANFIFKSDVTWNASGVLICGLTFRAEENLDRGRQYQFYFYRLSGLPAYEIDVMEFGGLKNTVSDVKFSDGIDSNNDAVNEFVLVAQDEQFSVYINGKLQGNFYDSSRQRTDGLLAFLGWQESGEGQCTFENSWLWVLK